MKKDVSLSIKDAGEKKGFTIVWVLEPGVNDKVVYRAAKKMLKEWIELQNPANQVERRTEDGG